MKTFLSIVLAFFSALIVVGTITLNNISNEKIEQSIKKHKRVDEVTVKTYKLYSEEIGIKGQDGKLLPQDISKQIFTTKLLLQDKDHFEDTNKTESISVTSGNRSGKGVYFDTDKVITCYHIYDKETEKVSVNGYQATILEYNEIDDYMILETLLDTENYVRDTQADDIYILQENVVKGDSGMPVYDKDNRLYGIILGRRDDGRIEVLDTREILKNFSNKHI